MTDSIEKIEVSGAGLTVSRLVWNRFREPKPEVVSKIYDINPGLAEKGTQIPIGTVVLIPIPESNDSQIIEQITLWS